MDLFSRSVKPMICAVLAALVLLGAAPAALASEDAPGPAPASEGATVDAPETAAAEDPLYEDPLYMRYNGGVATIACIPASYSEVTPRAMDKTETLRKGVDVSYYQGGNIDWKRAAADGVEFAIIRVGFRTIISGELTEDLYYKQNLSGARAAGIKVGAYFYSQATTVEEAWEEARETIRLVRGYKLDLPLVFDFEEADSSYEKRRLVMDELDKQLKTDMCKAFCQEVEQAGYESMVYSNLHMLSYDLDPSQLGRLWLAHWTAETDYAGPYEYWQFGIGSVDGISGQVDLDYWFEPAGKQSPPSTAPSVSPSPSPSPSPTPAPGTETPPAPEQGDPFTDVKQSDWFYGEVMAAYENKLVNGVGGGKFEPNATASRAAVVTMLYRMEGQPAPGGEAGFTDLTEEYYRDAVNWAAGKGIVNGESKERFAPNGSILREQLAAMLYRMSGSPAVTGDLSAFSDGEFVQSYARDAMIWAVKKGLVNGDAGGTLRPGSTATRAEVCAMLVRFMNMGQ